MIIAQISDTHIALGTPDAEQRRRDFERTIDDINTLDSTPDAIVHTGDIVHNGRPDEYAVAASILKNARAPSYVMVGNKDDRENLRAAFTDQVYLTNETGFIDYAIDDFPVRLIVLDTLQPDHNRGDFCGERERRLTDLLETETTKPIAVFCHHPPFKVLVGPDRFHFSDLETMDRLRKALQNSGRVIGVFSGHVHRSTAGKVGDIPAFVVSSVATTIRWDDMPPEMKTKPVYYIHRFHADGAFTTEARIVMDG